ncbi:hypothetical protein T4D_12645, partial [Trichinella pseudospiralis]
GEKTAVWILQVDESFTVDKSRKQWQRNFRQQLKRNHGITSVKTKSRLTPDKVQTKHSYKMTS